MSGRIKKKQDDTIMFAPPLRVVVDGCIVVTPTVPAGSPAVGAFLGDT